MLPNGSLLYFVLLIIVGLVLFVGRSQFPRYGVSLWGALLCLHLLYYAICFPKPIHILVAAAYFYLIYYGYHLVSGRKMPLWLALTLTLAPMIVARSTAEIQFVGLSYVTFRAFHVLMDARNMESISPARHAMFLFFFPSLLAGPIDRWQNFSPQVQKGFEALSAERFMDGYRLILLGAVMKFVGAEWLGRALSGLPKSWWSELYGYSAFLYFDFAGYSMMAIGGGLLLGIRLPDNFNQPFLSQNPQDFWRRFHITLGDFLRDFFFKPIYKWLHGFSRLTAAPLLKQNIALFLTFLLMGCWNGLKWHYVLSGALFGVYSVVFNSYQFWYKRERKTFVIPRWIAILVTVNLCCLALYIFSGRMRF